MEIARHAVQRIWMHGKWAYRAFVPQQFKTRMFCFWIIVSAVTDDQYEIQRFNPISVLTVTRSLAIFILSIIKLCFWWPPCCIVLCTVINDAWGLNKTTTERRWLVITSIQIVDITVHQQSDTTYTIQYCTRHVAKSKPQQRSNCPQQAHDEKAFKSERPNYLSWRHREQSATFNTALRTRRAL